MDLHCPDRARIDLTWTYCGGPVHGKRMVACYRARDRVDPDARVTDTCSQQASSWKLTMIDRERKSETIVSVRNSQYPTSPKALEGFIEACFTACCQSPRANRRRRCLEVKSGSVPDVWLTSVHCAYVSGIVVHRRRHEDNMTEGPFQTMYLRSLAAWSALCDAGVFLTWTRTLKSVQYVLVATVVLLLHTAVDLIWRAE